MHCQQVQSVRVSIKLSVTNVVDCINFLRYFKLYLPFYFTFSHYKISTIPRLPKVQTSLFNIAMGFQQIFSPISISGQKMAGFRRRRLGPIHFRQQLHFLELLRRP